MCLHALLYEDWPRAKSGIDWVQTFYHPFLEQKKSWMLHVFAFRKFDKECFLVVFEQIQKLGQLVMPTNLLACSQLLVSHPQGFLLFLCMELLVFIQLILNLP